MTRRMITAEELALRLGLVDDDGKPAFVEGIRDKAATRAWPSRLVNGKLRFCDPDDVDAIFELCKRGPEDQPTPTVVPDDAKPSRRRTARTQPAKRETRPGGLTGFRDIPLSTRRGSA